MEYFVLLSALLISTIATVFISQPNGIVIVYLFVLGMFVGPLLEWTIGWFYHQINAKRLWTYQRSVISQRHKYTSYMIIPFWGGCLVFVYLFINGFGLFSGGATTDPIVFATIVVSTLALMCLVTITRDTKRFVLIEYLAMLLCLSLVVVASYISEGITTVYVYVIGLVFGPIGEWVYGRVFHRINGERLWIYNKMNITKYKYTSYLIAPIWGVGVVILYHCIEFIL